MLTKMPKVPHKIILKKAARDRMIMVRLTEEQHASLERRAKAQGYFLSTWVLEAALNYMVDE